MGKAAYNRQKGHDFERWVAKRLRKIFPKARRHLEYHGIDSEAGIDLVDTGEFLIQCKRLKRYASITAIKEVRVDPIEGGIPVLVTQANREEPMAVLPFEDFVRLMELLYVKKRPVME